MILARHSGIFLCRFWSKEKYLESKNWFEEIPDKSFGWKKCQKIFWNDGQ
jgi:hypothetical protein